MADGKHPGGRPTVATPEKVERAFEYVNGGWEKAGDVIPTVEGMAVELGISKDTLYERDEFSDVLGKLKSLQARKLINGGLNGDYTPVIAKLLLASKHGYVEKSEKALTGKAGGAIAFVDMASDDGEA